MQLQGKTALVTGGGQDIGRGIVECFLKEGANVAIVQRQLLDHELQRHPAVFGVEADLTDPSVIPGAIQQTLDHFGGIDVLVNNAGIMFERSVADIQVEEWDRMMALNLRAPISWYRPCYHTCANAVVEVSSTSAQLRAWPRTQATPPTAPLKQGFTE